MEIWKDIPGYGNHYQASSLGKIRSKDRIITKFSVLVGKVVKQNYKGRLLRNKPDKNGYIVVHLGVNKKKYNVQVGRLVLMAFCGMPEKDQECCHNNGNPSDNSIANLRWDTHFENNQDRVKHGTYARGEDHHQSKLTEDQVRYIFSSEERGCDLALRFSVNQTIISDIRKRRIWKNVTDGMDPVKVKKWRSNEKLDKEKAFLIRVMKKSGSLHEEIAEKFNISVSTVSSVVNGVTWK